MWLELYLTSKRYHLQRNRIDYQPLLFRKEARVAATKGWMGETSGCVKNGSSSLQRGNLEKQRMKTQNPGLKKARLFLHGDSVEWVCSLFGHCILPRS